VVVAKHDLFVLVLGTTENGFGSHDLNFNSLGNARSVVGNLGNGWEGARRNFVGSCTGG
jgi:hypothetical protein